MTAPLERITAKGQLVPLIFSQDAAADSQSAVAMNIIETGASSGVLTTTEYQIPWDFDVLGVSVVSDLARTAGTLTVNPTINGTVTGCTAALSASPTTRNYTTQPRESAASRGLAGDRIGCKLTTASWTPVAADIVVVVWVLVHLAGI